MDNDFTRNNEQLPDPNIAQNSDAEIVGSSPRERPPEAMMEASDENPENSEQQVGEEQSGGAAEEGATPLAKNKLILLAAGLLVALIFFVFAAVVAHEGTRHHASPVFRTKAAQQAEGAPKGSVTPLMNAPPQPSSDDTDGLLTSGDIEQMRSVANSTQPTIPEAESSKPGFAPKEAETLGDVPSFANTQQQWEEPKPYEPSESSSVPPSAAPQSLVKESSLVFVRTQVLGAQSGPSQPSVEHVPFLAMAPGSRILAKLSTEISSADPTTVVADVQYTFEIGDQTVIPAGARIIGELVQADPSGYVRVSFNEIDLLDGQRERIDAVGKALDMGPIRGVVTGRNTGKNLLVRSLSGIGSTLAMVFGTNTGAAYSQDDLIRERLAENIGSAGDSEIMNLNANSRTVVTVPANKNIYVVFEQDEQAAAKEPATDHSSTK